MENVISLSKTGVVAELTRILEAAKYRFPVLANARVFLQDCRPVQCDAYGTVEENSFVCIYFNIWKGRFSIESAKQAYDNAVIWIAEEVSRTLGLTYLVAVTDPTLVKQHLDQCPYCGHGQKTCQHCGAPV
jgi:hypothetical protein